MTFDTANHPIILFDGHCNLCNGWVDFVIKYDDRRRFRFAALQAEAGRVAKGNFNLPEQYADSIILIYKGRSYYKSGAGLRILRLLGGIWLILYGFILVPPFIRNWAYDFVARNRYKWYGKRESCRLPTAEEQERFL